MNQASFQIDHIPSRERLKPQALALPGVVHGFGREAEVAAKLYATLTGRPYSQHESLDELKAGCHDVVVCLTERLTARLMHQLYVMANTAGVPGLICAPTPNALKKVCHRIASRFTRTSPVEKKRVFLIPIIDFGVKKSESDVRIGGTAPESVLPTLSAGASVLSIWDHGNGLDLRLSANQFACPFLDVTVSNGEFSAPCQMLGKCVRFPSMPSIEEAQRKGWIVPLSGIRAEVGIIIGCKVLPVRNGVIDPAYGLAGAMLRQADFGVLITTWRKEFSADINGLINEICKGEMAGIAVRAFNKSPLASRLGISLCLLGDPCFALPAGLTFTNLPQTPTSPVREEGPVEASERPENSEVELLLAAALAAPKTNLHFDTGKADALRYALSECNDAMVRSDNLLKESAIQDADLALLDFLGHFPRLDLFFNSFSFPGEVSEDGLCPLCLAPARIILMTFPKYAAKPRRIISCACCDDVSNLPIEWNVTPDLSQIDEGSILLHGVPTIAQITVSFTSLWGSLYQASTWPAPDGGKVVIRLPEELPLMPMWVRVLIVRHLEIGTVAFKIRKLSSGAYSTPLST